MRNQTEKRLTNPKPFEPLPWKRLEQWKPWNPFKIVSLPENGCP